MYPFQNRILILVYNKSVHEALKYIENKKKTYKINLKHFGELFSYVGYNIKNDLPDNFMNTLNDDSNSFTVLFYYFIRNSFSENLIQRDISLSYLFNLFTIMLEQLSTVSMFDYCLSNFTNQIENKYYELYSLVDLTLELENISSDFSKNIVKLSLLENIIREEISVQLGGNVNNYNLLKEQLEKVYEPRHDFSKKDRNPYNNVREIFNKSYKGSMDNYEEEFIVVSRELDNFIKLGNPFYDSKNIDLWKIANSEMFEANIFTYFHNFSTFSDSEIEQDPLFSFKYVSLTSGENMALGSIIDLTKRTTPTKLLSIEAFKQSILLANNINYHMDDITPTGAISKIYSASDNEIVSAASIWDPNSKNTIKPASYFPHILDTYLETPNKFPKRLSIKSGNIKLSWWVNYRPIDKPLEIFVNVFTNTQDKIYTAQLKESIGVTEITKLMYYVKKGELPADEPLEIDTNEIYQNIIKPINTDFVTIPKVDREKVLFALLLDFKKTGDWGQINWIDNYNSDEPLNKCMLVTKDKLCGLEAILVGIPTLVGNDIKGIRGKVKDIISSIGKGKREIEDITNVINSFSFIFYQGKSQGLTNGNITSHLNGCFAKLSYIDPTQDDLYPPIESSDLIQRFPLSTQFFGEELLQKLIEGFNSDLGIFKGFIARLANPNDNSQTVDISPYTQLEVTSKMKDMDTFAKLLYELETYIDKLDKVRQFIERALATAIITLGWFTSQKSYKELEDAIYNTQPAQSAARRSSRKEDIIKTILQIDLEEICKLKFINRENQEPVIKQLLTIIGGFYNEIYENNIKSLFGSIYCKFIEECSYFNPAEKLDVKKSLHDIVFRQSAEDQLEDKKQLIYKCQKFIAIIECILEKKEQMFVARDFTSTNQKLVDRIRSILKEMTDSLEV